MPAKKLPRHRIVSLLKERRVPQREIAERARVNQPYVSKVISRRIRNTAPAERVWRAIEHALTRSVA